MVKRVEDEGQFQPGGSGFDSQSGHWLFKVETFYDFIWHKSFILLITQHKIGYESL